MACPFYAMHDTGRGLKPSMGGTGRVLIFYGKTEQDMMRDLAEFIGPETKVNIDPRLADS